MPGPVTLGDLGRRDAANDDGERDNEFYTGGAQSGMAVQDPNSGRGRGGGGAGRGEFIQGVFDSAREHGAETGTADDLAPQGGRSGGAFSGAARRLDGTEVAGAAGGEGGAEGPPEAVPRVVYFWDNGFSVDDGPLRSLEDPANRSFVEALQQGQCPRELAPEDPNQPVNVNLVRKSGDYVEPPKPKYVAFGGGGRSLRGEQAAPAGADAPAGGACSSAPPSRAAPADFAVDESQPTTRVQIRLADGSRLVARFNQSHTVADVRNFIALQRADGPSSYSLVTGPPMPTALEDDSVTLKEAGLLGAVILQK